ncbi:MAG: class I SAM-dependent methyltransferase [Gemmataceae bacterium]|nr:class I SAM-dependent methyltransferase [Gemmataceae bacterium]
MELPAGGDLPAEATHRLFHREAFRKPPREFAPEAFSPDWFAMVEDDRYRRQGYWLPRSLEFTKHAGETVLTLGEGLGTDWVQYAKNGAEVITVCPSHEQLGVIRANFEQRGLPAKFLHSSPDSLPIVDDSVDVACLFGLIGDVDDPAGVVAEMYRVLRPGGKVIAVVAAQYNAEFWKHSCFPWRKWFGKPSGAGGPGHTGAGLKGLFGGFVEHKLSKRHLRRGELPPVWRWVPLPLLERAMGNLLILKAFKPLTAAAARKAA